MNEEKEITIEEAFSELEKLLSAMEKGDDSLEETFAKYQKGLELVRFCSGKIDGIEKQIKILEAAAEEQA